MKKKLLNYVQYKFVIVCVKMFNFSCILLQITLVAVFYLLQHYIHY